MQLFSSFGAAELLERDRQTLQRALRNIPPDGKERGQPRWKMSTIVDALSAHGASIDGRTSGNSLANEIEAGFTKIDGMLDRLKAEKNLERRRALAAKIEVGQSIRALDRQMTEANKSDERMGSIMQVATDKLIGSLMSRLIELCDWLDVVEAAKQNASTGLN